MANNNSFSMTLPILDSKNYDRWRNHMKAIFGFQEVLEIVQKGYQEIGEGATEAQRTMYNEAEKKDCKTLFLIYQGVDAANYEKINGAETAKQAWDSLEKCYEGVAKIKKVKLQNLRRQYEILKMEDNESIADYMTKILTLSNQMRSCGKAIKEKSIVEKVLRTLTCKYDHIVVAIEESKNLEELKIEELQASLEAHELRLKGRNSGRVGDEAFLSRHNKKNSNQWNKKTKERGHNTKWKTNESSSSTRNPEQNGARNGNDLYQGKNNHKNSDTIKKVDKKKLQCYPINGRRLEKMKLDLQKGKVQAVLVMNTAY
ncbi:PREDICTED: uncharacterized protein LOC109339535 [Lupinus angustifolius]|uniref:uncharacterized protein LOC109339535 n=1 Tax=Lupinus angustifolius TaxID=3871 RepID=UPI00092EB6FB|nr:PREDICTED: uncharacterized protein LOC109339535 [Lupinus angustifolius]